MNPKMKLMKLFLHSGCCDILVVRYSAKLYIYECYTSQATEANFDLQIPKTRRFRF